MRFSTLVFSIVLHVSALVAVIIVPLVASDVLPDVREVIDFVQATPAALPDLPAPPRPAGEQPAREVTSVPAPFVAPDRIMPETGIEPTDISVPVAGPGGVPGGMPGGAPLPEVSVPPPPPLPREPVRPGGKIRPPQKIKDVAPVYPHMAQQAGVQGLVILEAVIGENGRVRDVRVLRSNPLLDQAAVDAVRQWQFTPTLLNGEPVPVVMTVTVAFKLR